MSISQALKSEIESAAEKLGVSASTVGRQAGQGGHFYKRLCEGKRCWPETAQSVRELIVKMYAEAGV